ncbi:MAG: PEP-CTERM sorting domain-containing protein [Alphaproteobacteria bacterium]|nr:MAG: PEP-CTERM sorting domain-containing protein [Alphaproteobacteria bacterium]
MPAEFEAVSERLARRDSGIDRFGGVIMRTILFLFALFSLLASPATATPVLIGVPVAGPGDATPVAATDPVSGSFDVYIPYTGGLAGVFGVGGVGLASSVATPREADHSGAIDLWLRFDAPRAGHGRVAIEFADLDLAGVADPTGFRESLDIFDALGTSLLAVGSAGDPGVEAADSTRQLIGLAIPVRGGPLYLRLRLGADAGAFVGRRLRNTSEQVAATLAVVPEPEALFLFAAGLLGLIARMRRGQWRCCR